MSLTFASNLTKMIDAGLGGEVIAPDTSVAIGYRMQYNLVSGPVASWNDPEGGLPINIAAEFGPIQAGTGDPSPENVRPISGRTAVTVTRSGTNVWDKTYYDKSVWNDAGVLITFQTNSCTGKIAVKPGVSYWIGSLPYTITIKFFDSDMNLLSKRDINTAVSNRVVTAPDNASVMIGNLNSATFPVDTFFVNYPSTDYDYHPSTVASVEFQLGQTVYSGRLNVTSGVMAVNRKLLDLGMVTYSKSTRVANCFVGISGLPSDFPVAPSAFIVPNWICSRYKVYSNNGIESSGVSYGISYRISGTNKGVFIKDNSCEELYNNNDMEGFKALMSGVQLVYELENPLTVQLSTQTINSLLGQNNVWSDAGDVSVTWKEKLYTEGY